MEKGKGKEKTKQNNSSTVVIQTLNCQIPALQLAKMKNFTEELKYMKK